MIVLSGGSVGLQIGVSAVDVVMLIMNEEGVRLFLRSKFSLGGDASIAAGPVGRAGTAETDAFMDAKILTYSRSKGLFAGLEIKGAVVKADWDANFALYGRRVEAKHLLRSGNVAIPKLALPFIDTLERRSPRRRP